LKKEARVMNLVMHDVTNDKEPLFILSLEQIPFITIKIILKNQFTNEFQKLNGDN
jgi:hypothetical protein